METQLVPWGNGQGIRIPKHVMKECGFRLNESLELHIDNGRIVIEKSSRHQSLEERAEKYGGKLGPYEEFEWGSPVGREVW